MRRLVFCFDGSWNELSLKKEPTNVAIVAQSVIPVYKDENDREYPQIIYYDEGVGTSSDDVFRGGIFGQGLFENIREAYRFLIFNYQAGDEIFVFGFSRGAFTALSFIGFIRAAGVLSVDHSRRIDEAYKKYDQYADDIDDDPAELQEYRARYSPFVMVDRADKDWRENNGYDVSIAEILRIRYVGVWDTVGALGWTVVKSFFDRRTNKQYRNHDTNLSMMVEEGRHAVSIDEKRVFFAPTLWGNVSQLNSFRDTSSFNDDAPYQQKWFPGDHGSVGGGGIRRGLSNAALHWIIDGAVSQGLKLNLTSGSEIRDIRYDHTEALHNTPITGFFAKAWKAIKGVIISASRSGPDNINDIHPAALRRWFADPLTMKDGKIYRPRTLAHLSDKIASLERIFVPLELKSPMRTYEVQVGDSLSKIARDELGDPNRWKELFELNRDKLDNPDHIFPGDLIRIPQI